ncbi:MAG: hypothetical protein QXF87_09185 [Thermofilaceae archaeon]
MFDYDIAGLYMVASWMRAHVIKLIAEAPAGELEGYLVELLRDLTKLEEKLHEGFLKDWSAQA